MFVVPVSRSLHRAAIPSFSRAIEHLLDPAWGVESSSPATPNGPRTPALDVNESDTDYTLVLDMPGVTREQIKVSVQGRRVSIESDATSAPESGTPEATAQRGLYRERRAARYARTVSLPAPVDESASQAKLDHGVLTLRLLKKVPTGATRVNVN